MNKEKKLFMNGLYGRTGKDGFGVEDEIYLMCFSAFREGFKAGADYTRSEWVNRLAKHISGCKDLKCHCKLFSKPAD